MGISLGANLGIGLSADGISVSADVSIGIGNATITNIPVPTPSSALYGLAIRAPGQAAALVQGYTFPLSPTSVGKEYTALSTVYETAGPAGTGGVTRSIDRYGITLPYFSIEGTTGWQRHSTDGFAFTGLQSIAALQSLFISYETLNQQQVANNIPQLYSMEFYDYFANEFWQIEPVGRQGVIVDASRPLLYRYSFRWAAVRPLSLPPGPPPFDAIAASFSIGVGQATVGLSASLNIGLSAYAPSVGLSGSLSAGISL